MTGTLPAIELGAWRSAALPFGTVQAAEASPPTALELRPVEALLCEWLDAAEGRFGSLALGLIDLPPLSSARVEPAHLKLAAAAWWLMCVDQGGLPGLVERIAAGTARGTLALPVDAASAAQLVRFHREAEESFAPEERQALWTRLFGAGAPPDQAHPVRDGLPRLVRELVALGRSATPAAQPHQARVAMQALGVASHLSEQAVGVTGFAVQHLTRRLSEALSLLRSPSLNAALGGGDLASTMRRHAPQLLPQALDWTLAVGRAEAGRTLLQWVATQGAALSSGTVRLQPTDPVVGAAERLLALETVR